MSEKGNHLITLRASLYVKMLSSASYNLFTLSFLRFKLSRCTITPIKSSIFQSMDQSLKLHPQKIIVRTIESLSSSHSALNLTK
ncbi:hypothetical protein FGO68_gene10757 [Halteria grandinella]|uniref:Uncharacterized protein n=1 Tax=Halteria grandinella TaxID=5974 RepID=A0A8J8SUW2_HALGN|nr:hypothetical protein FGO68_gene10757 [Halteria grandinella]